MTTTNQWTKFWAEFWGFFRGAFQELRHPQPTTILLGSLWIFIMALIAVYIQTEGA